MDTWVEQTREIISRTLTARGWTLVSAGTDFVERVIAELLTRYNALDSIPSEAIARATVRCYTRVLYEACGADGTVSQQRAFQELWDYLYPHAVYRLHDSNAAQDATQQTLVKIFKKRATCLDAGSFLRWCDQILVNAIRERFREQYERRLTERGIEYVEKEIGLDELTEDEMSGEPKQAEEFVRDPKQDTPDSALHAPMRDALTTALRTCLDNERQVTLIVELFLNDKSFVQVAEQLQTTPLNVQVMKSRALKKLRNCSEMQNLFGDWLA